MADEDREIDEQSDSHVDTMSLSLQEVRATAQAQQMREQYREQKTRPLFDTENADTSRARGLIVLDGESPGRKIVVPDKGLVIGRSTSCDLKVGNSGDGTSRAHARVYYENGNLAMEDLNSRNGTLVNNRVCPGRRLYPGDKLQVGSTLFKVISGGEDVAHHESIYQMARRDPRTGLFEPDSIEAILTQEIKFSLRYKRPLSVFMLDIDYFSEIEEKFGQAASDCARVVVGKLLLSFVRSQDLALHYRNTTMLVVLPQTEVSHAVNCAERFCRIVAQHPIEVEGESLGVTVSIGVAQFRQSAVGLIHKVKEALSIGQRTGGNRVTRARRMTRKLRGD